MIMTKARAAGAAVSGEAPVASRPAEHIADPSAGGARPARQPESSRVRSRTGSRAALPSNERHYNRTVDGRELTNRRGRPLCEKFQTGECTTWPCPIDPRNVHQCEKCLGPHPGKVPPCPNSSKGKGKGKGKKGKGGKR